MALVAAGLIAVSVQVATYAVARSAVGRPGRPIMIAWGGGMLIRLMALAAFAWVGLEPWQLPAVPTLVGLVIFFFVTTLLEPFLLPR